VSLKVCIRSIRSAAFELPALSKHVSVLLNGWNEIAKNQSDRASTALRQLERDFPAAGIMVAKRTHYISPPLPGAIRAKLLPFNWRQQADYLRQGLGDRADELRLKLEANRVLDDLTRTPLILAEVVTIFQSGDPIPTTRIGLLGGVMKLIENSDEHRPGLRAPPLSNGAQHYLEKLASQMTTHGEVVITDQDARQVIQAGSAGLLAKSQIATAPDPATVLHALSAHARQRRPDFLFKVRAVAHIAFWPFVKSRRATMTAKINATGSSPLSRSKRGVTSAISHALKRLRPSISIPPSASMMMGCNDPWALMSAARSASSSSAIIGKRAATG
jgi:hypothetical protein